MLSSPLHDGMLRIILGGLEKLDEMLCSIDECERICDRECPGGTATGCNIHPQLEDCLSLWQKDEMREENSCSPCRDHIHIQQVIDKLEAISPSASEKNRKQEEALKEALRFHSMRKKTHGR